VGKLFLIKFLMEYFFFKLPIPQKNAKLPYTFCGFRYVQMCFDFLMPKINTLVIKQNNKYQSVIPTQIKSNSNPSQPWLSKGGTWVLGQTLLLTKLLIRWSTLSERFSISLSLFI
jgi:hypothetical protein